MLVVIASGYYILNYRLGFFVSFGFDDNTMRLHYFGFSLTGFSIIIAAQQYRKNHLWNRKITAIESALKIKSDTEPSIVYLTKKIDYRNTSSNKYFTVDFLHEQMCVQNKDSTNEYDKYELDPKTRKYKVSKKGQEFIKHLNALLNNYEYLAVGIRNGIFDENTIKSFYRGAIIKCYNNFSIYIEHYNSEMAPERSSTIWINLKLLALEWSGEDIKELESKNGRIYPIT